MAAVSSLNSSMPGLIFLRTSSLDDPEVFKPQMAVYTKGAASWDETDPALPSFEAMPPPEAMPNSLRSSSLSSMRASTSIAFSAKASINPNLRSHSATSIGTPCRSKLRTPVQHNHPSLRAAPQV